MVPEKGLKTVVVVERRFSLSFGTRGDVADITHVKVYVN